MNDDEATMLLDRLGTQVEVGSPPIKDIFTDGNRVKRRRRGLQVAGSAAVVFALALGGYALKPGPGVENATTVAPTPTVTTGVTGLVTPPGSRLVGEGGVVVAVPQSWTTNDVGCMGMVNSDTVTFNNDGPWAACAGGDSDASVLSVVDSSSSQWETRLQKTANEVSVDGMRASRTATVCTAPRQGSICSAALTFPDQQVSFLVTSLDVQVVEDVLDSAQRLPAGWVNVPDIAVMSVSEARQGLAAQGLAMNPQCITSECRSYAVGTTPAAGTAVAHGSTVTVTFYHHPYGQERPTTNVDGLTIRVWLPQETVRAGRTLRSRMLIENSTGKPILNDCTAGNPRYGLQRAGSQQVDWRQAVVDCAGRVLEPGFRSRSPGPGFIARTHTGEYLAPGRYFALADFGGGSPWIRYKVTVLPAR